MSDNKIDFWGSLGTGVAIGVVGSTLSMISDELLRVKFGYSSMSIKNVIKVSITSAVTTLAVLYGLDEIKKQMDN